MHTAEEVRTKTNHLRGLFGQHELREMLLAYADLLEAMEELHCNKAVEPRLYVNEIRQRAAEKQKARKGT